MADIFLRFWSGLERQKASRMTVFNRSMNKGDAWIERAIAASEVCEIAYRHPATDKMVVQDLDLVGGNDAAAAIRRGLRDINAEIVVLWHCDSQADLGITGMVVG